jgi:hypothetical protein
MRPFLPWFLGVSIAVSIPPYLFYVGSQWRW